MAGPPPVETLLQAVIGEEAKPFPIRRKERPVATLRSGYRHCFGLIERPFVKLSRRPGRAREDQHIAIGREGHSGAMGTAKAVVSQMLGERQFERRPGLVWEADVAGTR